MRSFPLFRRRTSKAKTDASSSKAKSSAARAKSSGTKEPSSGALYTAIVNSSVLASEAPSESFYIDSGASTHLIPTKDGLRGYREFDEPLETSAANSGKPYAYGSGTRA